MLIAIDGPTASGKGTIAKRIAAQYGLPHLDTGRLYRAVGQALLDAGADPHDAARAATAAAALDPASIEESRIRTAAVAQAASIVAAQPGVRAALFTLQRAFAQQPGGAVLDGRDIGAVICPGADVKLYVTASLPERAARRWKELQERGETIALAELARQIAERDERDSGRADAPLRAAPDAHLLDTTALSADAAVAAAIAIIDAQIAAKPPA